MKNFTLPCFILLLYCCGCATSRSGTYKNSFAAAFAALEQQPSNAKKLSQANKLYAAAAARQLAMINKQQQPGNKNHDRLVQAYSNLQQMYLTVSISACCSTLVPVKDYHQPLQAAREAAAACYYSQAAELEAMAAGNTDDIRRAAGAYQKALYYVPGYRDAIAKVHELFSNNSFVVAFNPVEDSSFFADRAYSSTYYTMVNKLFIDNLIKELDAEKSSIPFLLLLPYSQCIEFGISPDWIVDISLPAFSVNITSSVESYQVYESVPAGTDSSGNTIYQQVREARYRTCDIFNSGAVQLQIDITDAANGKSVVSDSISVAAGFQPFVSCQGDQYMYTAGTNSLRDATVNRVCNYLYPLYKKKIQAVLER